MVIEALVHFNFIPISMSYLETVQHDGELTAHLLWIMINISHHKDYDAHFVQPEQPLLGILNEILRLNTETRLAQNALWLLSHMA